MRERRAPGARSLLLGGVLQVRVAVSGVELAVRRRPALDARGRIELRADNYTHEFTRIQQIPSKDCATPSLGQIC